MEELQDNLNAVIKYLLPYLPLSNAHTVDFIVESVWERKIPYGIRKEVESLGVDAVIERLWHLLQHETYSASDSCKLFHFIKNANNHVIEKFRCLYHVNELTRILPNIFESHLQEHVEVTEFMSAKKMHEVHIMSNVVASVAQASKSSVIVDIGSGKGYLPSLLALNHHLRILGIDDKRTNIEGAVRTIKMFEKKWKLYEEKTSSKHSQPTTSDNIDKFFPLNERKTAIDETSQSFSKPTVLGISYKHRLECVSSQTNMNKILSEEYPNEVEHSILFVGLHTCGNLSPNSLKLFVNCDQKKKSIVNVGCCYHLIEEEFSANPAWHRQRTSQKHINTDNEYGFPLSAFLRAKKFSLGRDTRMCGTQNPFKIFKDQELILATKPLFYRALLQKLMILKCGPSNLPNGIVGRMAHKCFSFAEYAMKALKKLNVSIQISPAELDEFEFKHKEDWQQLKIFFLLKTALSRVIETVILLDKLIYLHEQDIETAFIIRLFNPVMSPRCYAIVATHGMNK